MANLYNSGHYVDPTAFQALSNIEFEEKRARRAKERSDRRKARRKANRAARKEAERQQNDEQTQENTPINNHSEEDSV